MLRRGYIVLIAGVALLIAGIVISVLWAGFFARQFVRENAIVNETLSPHSFARTTLEVKDIERDVSLLLNSSSPVTHLFVTDPNNMPVKLEEFKLKEFKYGVIFKPEIAGKFTLHIINNSSNPVNLNGIFGYGATLPITIKNNQTDVNLLNGIFVGSSLVMSGIITLIIGIIFLILDRSRHRRPVTP